MCWVDRRFDLAVTPEGEMIYWSKIPGLVFHTQFTIRKDFENGGHEMVPDYEGREDPKAIPDRLFWYPAGEPASPPSGRLDIVLAFVVSAFCPDCRRTIKPMLSFRSVGSETGSTDGNYIPPIPNIFRDLKICMGGGYQNWIESGESIQGAVQRSIRWFYESKMNSHLVHDGVSDRSAAGSRLFRWGLGREPLPIPADWVRLTAGKSSNFHLDGLPL